MKRNRRSKMKAVNPVTLEHSLLGHYAVNITNKAQSKEATAQSTNSHYITKPPNYLFCEDAPGKFMSTSLFPTWRWSGQTGTAAVLTKGWPHSFIFVYSDSFSDIQVTFPIPDVLFLPSCYVFLRSSFKFKLFKLSTVWAPWDIPMGSDHPSTSMSFTM